MKNCLVTKLRESVTNSDLPVLEIMQDFTLDAITKSGNTNLTDEQQWALNQFFYQMEVFSNGELWNKVGALFIPMIGISKSTIVLDYKNDNAAIDELNEIVDQAGALEVTGTAGAIYSLTTNLPNVTTNIKDNALLVVSSATDTLGADTKFNIRYGTAYKNISIQGGGVLGGTISDGTLTASKRYGTLNMVCSLLNMEGSAMSLYGINDGDIVRNTDVAYGSYSDINGTVTNASYELGVAPGNKYGLIIDFNTRLADDECLVVVNAANALRNAFID